MYLRLKPHSTPLPLTYEMNAHPGENLQQLQSALLQYTIPIRNQLVAAGVLADHCSLDSQQFAIAPRIGRALLQDLSDPSRADKLHQLFKQKRLQPITVNAFPLEDFHATRVKERVYQPHWTEPERADLTIQIADWLARELPAGQVGTISTSGGSYRYPADPNSIPPEDPTQQQAMAQQYLRVVRHLAELEQQRGITIRLCVEPEPDTTFEIAADVIEFWRQYLLPQIHEQLAKPLAISDTAAEELLRRFFTVNFDVCHQSVLFRDPIAEWKQLERAGIAIAKLHLTSALAWEHSEQAAEAWQQLREFNEPRYLHQFAARHRITGEITRGRDLDQLDTLQASDYEEVRCHFHVPLSEPHMGLLKTTQQDTQKVLHLALQHTDPPQLVIETYTWPLLESKKESLIDGMVKEFHWVLKEIAHHARDH